MKAQLAIDTILSTLPRCIFSKAGENTTIGVRAKIEWYKL